MLSEPALPKAAALPRRPVVILALGWYSAAIHRGIARYALQERWILDSRMARTGHYRSSWKGDGIICNLGMDPVMDRLVEKAGIPVVSIGNHPHPTILRVSSDNTAVGRMAADYFLQRGFKHFAFYLRENSPGERERMAAYRDRVQEAGFRFYTLDRSGAEPPTGDFSRALARELARLPHPLAVFAEYDDLVIEVLDACITGDIHVPEQVALLGVGDDPLRCEFAPVPLSSIDDDEEFIGHEAAGLLARLMKGESDPGCPILIGPRGVTSRQSTDILAVNHPLVAMALRQIWEHYTEPINAKHIAATIPMSYRRLHDAFIQHVGHSMAYEITHKRIERAQNLLRETDKKLMEVARLSGFTGQERLNKVFKHLLGITPAGYRQKHKSNWSSSTLAIKPAPRLRPKK